MNINQVQPYKIYEVIAGSHSYGLNIPSSDLDKRGIFIEPKQYVLGMDNIEQVSDDKQDYVLYALRKFIKLASECNPNIIELLFTPDENVLFCNEIGKILRDNKSLFLTQQAKRTFTGYAMSQLKKIKGHHHWNNNPQPVSAPTIEEFMVTKRISDIRIEENIDGEIDFITGKSDREVNYFDIDAFRQKFRHWKQYWRWSQNRNPVRHQTETEHGFDTKHGMHLIRLLLMGKEILQTGEVVVKRPDREFLLDIRSGKYSYDSLVEMSEQLMNDIDNIKPIIPEQPDLEKINKLLINLYEENYYA